MTHLDLFSGIGGFAIAAQNCGYTTIGFCEREPYAQQILKERFGAVLADSSGSTVGAENDRRTEHQPHKGNKIRNEHRAGSPRPKLHDDIFQLSGHDYAGVSLLTGGFPCQPFSVAGKRKGAADDRAIWPQMLRVINEARPAWIIGENVAGIVTMELDNILSDLEAIGYAAWPLVVPACAVDARHRRDRVWIVAHTNDMRHKPILRETLSGWKCEAIANTESSGGSERGDSLLVEVQEGRDVAYADESFVEGNQCSERGESQRTDVSQCCQWRDESQWFAQSGMGRVAHGIPHRAHRLRGLGNAIVPQVAEEIIRAITPQNP